MGKRIGVHPPQRIFEQPKAGWRPIAGVAAGFALAMAAVIVAVLLAGTSRGVSSSRSA